MIYCRTPMSLNASDLAIKTWQETNEQVKNDYGNDHFENFKSYNDKMMAGLFRRTNIHEVVDAITKGVIKKSPDYRYQCVGLITRLLIIIWDCGPLHLTDLTWNLISLQKVNPKTVKTNLD